MKQLLLAASLTFLSLTSFAQGKTTSQLVGAATTQEEYNYATKGLKTQRAQGLDLRAGYLISNKASLPGGGGSTVTIEDLVRKADQSLACIIVQVSNPKLTEPLYLAIPNPASGGDMFGQYLKELNALDPAVAKMVLYSVSARLSSTQAIVVKMMK